MSERPEIDVINGDLVNSRGMYKTVGPLIIGKKVLEWGCGYGHGGNLLSPWSLEYTGYDCDEGTIKIGRERFKNIKLVHEEDSIKGVYDFIVSVEVIEHLEKDDLREKLDWFSKIAPEIYCTTPNGDLMPYHPRTMEERRGYHVWHYTYQELVELFSSYYKFVDVRGIIRDPKIGQFINYAVYASNKISVSSDFAFNIEEVGGF